MRFSLIVIILASSFTSSLFGQPSIPTVPTKMPTKIPTKIPTRPAPTPTTPSEPIYGYPGYYPSYPHTSPSTTPQIHTAKEQREQAKKEFEEKNDAKNSMTGQTRRSNPVKSDKAPEKKRQLILSPGKRQLCQQGHTTAANSKATNHLP